MEVPTRLCQPDRQLMRLIELDDGNGKTAEQFTGAASSKPAVDPSQVSAHCKIALIS